MSTASNVGCIRSTATTSVYCSSHLYLENQIESSILRELDKILLATAALIFVFAAVNFIFQSLIGSSLLLMLQVNYQLSVVLHVIFNHLLHLVLIITA